VKQDDINRMIDDIKRGLASGLGIEPQGKYKFSRNWYQAHFDSQYYFEVDEWCAKQFGPHPKHPDAWSRWWHKFEDSILFRDEKDYILFMLRWS
jgi:hypothetical protein